MSGAWVFMSGTLLFVAAVQGIPLDHLALEARGACVPDSHGTVSIKETIHGRLPPPGHFKDSRLKHNPSISEKEAYLIVQEP